MAKTKGTKSLLTVSINTDLVRRLDDLADARNVSRSSLVERFISDSIEDDETVVRFAADPVLMGAMAKIFGDRSMLKRMTEVISSEGTTPEQLRLFQTAITNITAVTIAKQAQSLRSVYSFSAWTIVNNSRMPPSNRDMAPMPMSMAVDLTLANSSRISSRAAVISLEIRSLASRRMPLINDEIGGSFGSCTLLSCIKSPLTLKAPLHCDQSTHRQTNQK